MMEYRDQIEKSTFTAQEGAKKAKDQMLSGTAWRTGADMLGKILGVIYIIPWFAWMGHAANQANALYSMGYNIYALFLLVSTVGIPSAVAREVARYNTLGDENMSYRLVRQMLGIMTLLGVLFAIIMSVFAGPLARLLGGSTALIPVIQSLSLAILLFPSMSVIRGYFQGLNQMKAYAMSQLCEQVIRIIWMLVTTFAIMKLGSHHWQSAVTQSTFAAFVGMLASYAVLLFYLYRSGNLKHLIHPGVAKSKINPLQVMGETMRTAVPFIVLGSATQVFRLIDNSTFMHFMPIFTNLSHGTLMSYLSYFSANTDKLTLLLLGVALTLGSVSDPLITEHYVRGNKHALATLVGYNFQLYAGFMLPAVVGMSLLVKPIYTLFYQIPSSFQVALFVFTVLQSFLLGLYMLVYPPLTVMSHKRLAMKFFFEMLIVKVVLQVPALFIFHSYGPLIATTIAFVFGDYLFIRKLYHLTHFSLKNTMRGIQGAALLTVIMSIVVVFVELILGLIFGKTPGRMISALLLVVSGGLGFYVYLFLAAQLGLLEKWFGERGTSLKRKLHL
ncbi:polysaccharide biosynthesis protein [Lactococcus hircilactis]|nr:polysaccharide biosynthesis protein [Lactococcus hircilactis]